MQKTYHFSTDFQWQVIESLITVRCKPKWEIKKIWEGMELIKRGLLKSKQYIVCFQNY